MQKIYGGRYLGSFGSHGSVAMSTNPHNVHRPKFSSFKRCPLTFSREHIMSHSKSTQFVQNQGQATTEVQNITFFMVLESETVNATVLSPRFETLSQAQAFLESIESIYEDAFIAQFEFFRQDPEERDRLSSLIVKEGV